MKIAHVSTFWPTTWFGFTYYTTNLIRGMRAHSPEKHFVAALEGADAKETEDYVAEPCWSKQRAYAADITGALHKAGVDVAIIQNNPDLFGHDNRLPDLCRALRDAGIMSVVNYHSVFRANMRTAYQPGRTAAAFDHAVGEASDCVTVHSSLMRSDLISHGVSPDKVVVVPHGSETMEQRDPRESRVALGLPEDARVVLFFGFIWLGKGLDHLLSVFARLARRVPDAYLYIGGYTRKRAIYNEIYMGYLRGRIRLLGIRPRTRLSGGFVPDDMVPTVYGAADVVALPYKQDYSSVSGVVHQTAGLGKLMLCSRISKFSEVTDYVSPELTVPSNDVSLWADKLERLLTDEAYAQDLQQRIKRFAEQTSWEAMGKRHWTLYQAVRAGQAPASIGAEWSPPDAAEPADAEPSS